MGTMCPSWRNWRSCEGCWWLFGHVQILICREEGEPYPPLRGYFPTAVGKLLGASSRFFSFPTAVGKWPEGPIGLPFVSSTNQYLPD